MASNGNPQGLAATYRKGMSLVESSPQEALEILQQVQRDCSALSLFSSNETLEDVSNKSIPLLAVSHFVAIATMNLPMEVGKMQIRKENILKAVDTWVHFLNQLEQLEQLSQTEKMQLEAIMEQGSGDDNGGNSSGNSSGNNNGALSAQMATINAAQQREDKIARFKLKQQCQQEMQRLQGLQQRRQRLGMEDNEDLDGFDSDQLERTVALQQLQIYKSEAFEQMQSAQRELPMVHMMLAREQDMQAKNRHRGGPSSHMQASPNDPRLAQHRQGTLKVTRVTKDNATGQLRFKREELKSQVFRPGWNQPTMSLEELADREVREAKEREARQKESEKEQSKAPRRYDQLVQDGMEDDADLVDASAKLDRDWDNFREANPRGSGNKRGDVGDRNF